MHIHMHMHNDTYTYMHMYIYIYTCIYVYTHTYIRTYGECSPMDDTDLRLILSQGKLDRIATPWTSGRSRVGIQVVNSVTLREHEWDHDWWLRTVKEDHTCRLAQRFCLVVWGNRLGLGIAMTAALRKRIDPTRSWHWDDGEETLCISRNQWVLSCPLAWLWIGPCDFDQEKLKPDWTRSGTWPTDGVEMVEVRMFWNLRAPKQILKFHFKKNHKDSIFFNFCWTIKIQHFHCSTWSIWARPWARQARELSTRSTRPSGQSFSARSVAIPSGRWW